MSNNATTIWQAPYPRLLRDHMASHNHDSMGLGSVMSVNASGILVQQQRHQIQVLATVTSTISIAAALCAMYWFALMRRNFRRDLVLLLITGDFWKSMMYFLYAVVTFARGQQLETYSRFCQAGGYLLTAGIEACDVAILLMSIHMSLQIFPPSNPFLGRYLDHDGLYRIRYWVIAAWFIIPNIMASLAFVNPGPAFQAAGAFCSLPIRPYWYRLALSWIPRYLIWIYVMAVAIRIYTHVGREFRVFGQEKDGSTSLKKPGESSVERAFATQALASARRKSTATGLFDLEKQNKDESLAPDDMSATRRKSTAPSQHSLHESASSVPYPASRRPSAPTWSAAFAFPVDPQAGLQPAQSAPASRRGSHQIAVGVQGEDFAPPSAPELARHRPSVTTLASVRSSVAPSIVSSPALALAPIREDKQTSASTGSTTARDAATNVVRCRRRAIQRQLRLLFTYPVVYIIIWIIPFVIHCFNYNDYYAQDPNYALSALNTFCQCFLGFADVTIFCWREKPWRHVPGSDGTFIGSFCFWRLWRSQDWMRRQSRAPIHVPNVEKRGAETEKSISQAGLLKAVKRWSLNRNDSSPRHSQDLAAPAVGGPPRTRSLSHRRTHSGGSDRKHLEIERAHERLALERAEWQANAKSREQRRDSLAGIQQAPGKREWWDRQLDDGSSVDRELEKEGVGS